MDWDKLSLVAAPTDVPVSLAEAKAHLLVDDNDSDGLIAAYTQRAIAVIDGPFGIGRCMVTQTWRMSLDQFPFGPFTIPLGPVASVTSIKYLDAGGAEQTLDPASYWQSLNRSPAEIHPAYGVSWPTYRAMPGSVKVDFVAGTPAAAVPADLKAAVLLLVGSYYANREAVNVGDSVTELPLGVTSILNRYRVGVLV